MQSERAKECTRTSRWVVVQGRRISNPERNAAVMLEKGRERVYGMGNVAAGEMLKLFRLRYRWSVGVSVGCEV